MDVYVIRHGQSTGNARQVFAGWAQVPLTEKGVEQAKKMRPMLEPLRFDKVIASDLLRAVQTAQGALPGYDIISDPRLREIHVGSLEGTSYAGFGPEFWKKRDYSAYGGEDHAMHLERVAAFMKDLEGEAEDGRIAVVCHEGTISCMLSYVMGFPLTRSSTPVFNGALCVFSFREGLWSLQKWNENGSAELD